MDYLNKASQKAENVSQADIVRGTGLSKAHVSRAFNDPSFDTLLVKQGYIKGTVERGKPTIIHL